MTATVRGGDRTLLDSYPTPAWCVHSLLRTVELPGGSWLEPSAGQGAIIQATNQVRDDVVWHAIEIDPACESSLSSMARVQVQDFLAVPPGDRFIVAITNPPFSRAQEFVQHAMNHAGIVVMLLRLAFMSSLGRFPLMSTNAPDVFVLPDRPQFAGTNRDSSDYAWFVWHSGRIRRTGAFHVLDPTPSGLREPFADDREPSVVDPLAWFTG